MNSLVRLLVPLLAISTLIASLVATPSSTYAAPPRVQVRGTSRIDVQASGPRDRLDIVGTLRDDVGAPIAHAILVVTAIVDSDVPVPWQAIGRCPVHDRSGEGVVDFDVATDSTGKFCLQGQLARESATIRIVYGGGPLHDGSRSDTPWNAQQQPMSIVFDPLPERIDLDEPRVSVVARVSVPEERSGYGLLLALTDERGLELGSASTGSDAAAYFDFPSKSLGTPGFGSLAVSFVGSKDIAPAQATTTTTRTVRVRLSTTDGNLRGNPSRGVIVRVRVESSRGPVQGGYVEAFVGSEPIGVGVVHDGVSEVTLTYAPQREHLTQPVLLHYQADAPFYIPGEPISIEVTAVEPSRLLRAVPFVIGTLIAGWLLRGWRRPRRRERPRKEPIAHRGVPSVDVVRQSTSSDRWTGRVIDAHEGTAIVGARVMVVAPTFVGVEALIDTQSDNTGAFAFRVGATNKSLRLLVEATHHGRVEQALPPASDMIVALATRRRLLLDRLVGWAWRAGKPWHEGPDPTPGHVVQVAVAQCDSAVARWARGVERGAFGPEPIDQRLDGELRDLEPQERARQAQR